MALNVRGRHEVDFEDAYLVPRSRLACSACRRQVRPSLRRKKTKCVSNQVLKAVSVHPCWRLLRGRRLTGSLVSSQRARKEAPMNGVRGSQHQWQGIINDNLEEDVDDCILLDEQGTDLSFNSRRAAISGDPSRADFFASSHGKFMAEELGADSNSSGSPDVESNFVKAISLSSLIHPTHEICSSPLPTRRDMSSSSSLLNLVGAQTLLTETCNVLGLSIRMFQRLIDSYFDNMTAFSLFHQPSFGYKIQNIENPRHLQALFAAMFSFSARFETASSIDGVDRQQIEPRTLDYRRFHHQALELIENSLKETSDTPPSLCLLQAMTLITFCELTNGVRGRAWRLLGSCVLVAYELHLHLIDYQAREEYVKVGQDLARWTADEERRRCWWAIWEMDNFASTIRRCPTAIDWNMIDTYLPVKDEFWFNNQYQRSCFLAREPINRWKMLKKCRNESPTAWLIVINSLMRNAQVLLRGNLQGVLLDVDPHDNTEQLLHYFRNSFRRKKTQEDSARLKTLVHALQNVISQLPESLVYQGEYLDFGSIADVENRRLHSAKYSIYLTIQLARFMIYHHYAFGEIVSGTIFSGKRNASEPGWSPSDRETPVSCQGLQNCLQAADDIWSLTTRCSEDHVKHVNPFLASTVWLAAALQVLRIVFGNEEDRDEAKSKCETLRATCERYTEFWHTPLALLDNLDSLEGRLFRYRDSSLAAAADQTRGSGSTISPSTSRGNGLRTTNIHPTANWGESQQKPPSDDGLTPKSGSPPSAAPHYHTGCAHLEEEEYQSPSGSSLFNFPPPPPSNNSSDRCPLHNNSNNNNNNNPVSSFSRSDHNVPADRDPFAGWGGGHDANRPRTG
ncbi:Fungal specific transcription factor [Rasamsonia emersonii CBS 393.64]|uniref:Fungal specific transcription factor n=1 Tax=Rasamsonia emersonii (strain ATCC 16479 / CBS 393.64 / IMI 116815) TaxID=1408163 RepID=A0A0F4YWN1_RASE3|nr:Fungal specific transcription factor [Rasamsonia emersonii CBS 393.64]KKA22697.1 Fungal specific transcription factor [Rasamsonia emersonii CBS 393.64]